MFPTIYLVSWHKTVPLKALFFTSEKSTVRQRAYVYHCSQQSFVLYPGSDVQSSYSYPS